MPIVHAPLLLVIAGLLRYELFLSVLFAEEEERHLHAYHVFIRDKKTFGLSIVQLMAVGGPRMGKSSLLARLRGEQPPTVQELTPVTAHCPAIKDDHPVVPSTGVAEEVIQLTTIREASIQPTFAHEVEGVVVWSRVSYGEEVIALLKAMGMSKSFESAPSAALPAVLLPVDETTNIQHVEVQSTSPEATATLLQTAATTRFVLNFNQHSLNNSL